MKQRGKQRGKGGASGKGAAAGAKGTSGNSRLPQEGTRANATAGKAVDPVGPGGSLQAPWRMEYLESLGEKESGAEKGSSGASKGGSDDGAASFLRDYWLAPQTDEKNHVIVRSDEGMILLNAFPYANGHLLVALGEGRGRLLDYSAQQRAALWRLTDVAADLMETALQPQGINIGVNQGRAGGAGVPGHLHVHLVPRWGGDINFMTAVAKVRVIPSSLEVMAKRYREAWGRIRERW